MNEPDYTRLESRIAKVEAHYESLSSALSSGFDEIKSMIRSNATTTRSEIDHLADRLETKTKPQTNIILQILGIGMTIAIVCGGLVAWRFEHMDNSINERDTVIDRRVDKNSKAIENIDVVLQREMRLLDSTIQREMRILDDQLKVNIERNEKDIEKLQEVIFVAEKKNGGEH